MLKGKFGNLSKGLKILWNDYRRMNTSIGESLDESNWMYTNVNKCKETKEKNFFFFDINGGFQDGCSLFCRRFLPQKHRWIKKFVLNCSYTVF